MILFLLSVTKKRAERSQIQIKMNKYRQKIRRLETKVTKLKEELKSKEESVKQNLTAEEIASSAAKYLSGTSLEFFRTQLMMSQRKLKGRRYSKPTRRFALSIYFRNKRTYTYLAKIFALPSRTMLQNYVSSFNIGAGWNSFAFSALKEKLEDLDQKDRVCCVSLDAMDISKGINYNTRKDKFDGFEDLASYGCTKRVAKQALVFMVQGVASKFKQVVGYFLFSSMMTSDAVKPMLIDCISKLKDIGVIPKVLVCDQGGPHRGLFRKLGATVTKPYFEHFHNSTKTRLYTLWDAPHLMKSIRNNLLNYDFLVGGARVSWKPIEFVHAQQEGDPKELRMVPKLTSKHVKPSNMERMRVPLAAQVLSKTMAAALKTIAEHMQDDANAAIFLNTSDFISKMDRLFDIFNSSGLDSHKLEKMPVLPDDRQIKVLEEEFLPWLKSIKVQRPERKKAKASTKKSVKSEDKLDTTPCIMGWRQNIACLRLLWEDLKRLGFEYLLTRRLDQDCLENFFGSVRNSGGHNDHPTSSAFHVIINGIITNNIMQVAVAGSNCENDMPVLEEMENTSKGSNTATEVNALNMETIEEMFDPSEMEEVELSSNTAYIELVIDDEADSLLEIDEITITLNADIDRDPVPKSVDILLNENRLIEVPLKEILDRETLSYVAGYLARAMKRHQCDTCQQALTENSNVTYCRRYRTFIYHKDWERRLKLNYAAPLLVDLTKKMDTVFKINIDNLLDKDNVRKILYNLCLLKLQTQELCQDGLHMLILKFITMRLHYYAKFFNYNLKSKTKKHLIENEDRRTNKKMKKLN